MLTAAHCLCKNRCSSFMDHDDIFVTVGHKKKNYGAAKSERRGFQEAGVVAILEHPKWRPKLLSGDIAMLKLDKDFILRPSAYPACLPTPRFDLNPNIDSQTPPVCIISGWGSTEGTSDDRVLLHATLPIMTNKARFSCETRTT